MNVKHYYKKFAAYLDNFFTIERDYFTIGGLKKDFFFFIKKNNIIHHLIDRIKFQYFPKFLISSSFPTHLEVEAASKCQMKCPMCWTTYMKENVKGIMKMDLYKKIVDEAALNNVFSIKLSWRGEPMLNPNLIEMIKYAKNKGIKNVAFLTNAELLTEKKCHEIIESECDWISISADGVDEIYNKIRFPAKFEETVEKVKYLKKIRDEKKLKKPLIRVQSILTAVENNSDKFYKTWESIADKINIITDQLRDYDLNESKIEYNEYFMCPKPFQRLAIAHDGKVHQCVSDYHGKNILGNVNHQSIKEVWDGDLNKKLRESFKNSTFLKENSACRQCAYTFKQDKNELKTISDKIKIKIRRYTSVPSIVTNGQIFKETPEELIPRNKIEEYKKILNKNN